MNKKKFLSGMLILAMLMTCAVPSAFVSAENTDTLSLAAEENGGEEQAKKYAFEYENIWSGTANENPTEIALDDYADGYNMLSPEKDGYIFEGWYTANDDETKDKVTVINSETYNTYLKDGLYTSLKLKAEWTRKLDSDTIKLRPNEEADVQLALADKTITDSVTFSSDNMPDGFVLSADGKITGKSEQVGENEVNIAVAPDTVDSVSVNSPKIKIIVKDKPTITVPTIDAVEYNAEKTLADVTLPSGWAWADSTQIPTVENEGYSAVYTPTAEELAQNWYDDVECTQTVTLTVNKANPVYTVPTDLSAVYGAALKDVTLPNGFSWQDSLDTSVGEVGENKFKATYTPSDTKNYNAVTGIEITVKVESQADKVVFPTVSESYDYGTPLSKIELTGGAGDGTFAWEKDSTVPDVSNSGYNVVFTPTDTTKEKQTAKVKVKILPVDVTMKSKPGATSIYVKEEVSASTLSGGVFIGVDDEKVTGSLSWADPSDIFTSSGKYPCDVTFTPDSSNYNETTFTITITVKSKSSSSSSGGGGGGSSSSMIGITSGLVAKTYTVTATANEGGSISPKGVTSVGSGKDLTYFITPDGGYSIESILVDGSPVYISTTYKFTDVTANHTLDVTFAKQGADTENTAVSASFDKDNHNAYISGYEDGTFKPDNNITRGEIAAVICRLLKNPIDETKVYDTSFTDVAGSWAKNYIGYIQSLNIVNGYSDGTFRPNETVTRAELLAIISRIEKVTGKNGVDFADIDDGHWAKGYIGYACEQGWVSGYEDGLFKPDNAVTRAETVKILNAVLGRNHTDADSFAGMAVKIYTDTDSTHWAYMQIIEASNAHKYKIDADREVWTELK